MKKTLPNICFLGTGLMAERHTKLLKKLYPKIKISYAGRDIAKTEAFCKSLKGFKAYPSYEDAINSKEIDIVFIVTPHAYHSKLAVLAANKKKHIIVEKPVTRTVKELDDILKAVKKNKVRFTVAENYYYKPAIKKIREYISAGYIGEPLMVELNKTNRDTLSGWRTDAKMMGGGALLEGGIHWVDALISLAGSSPKEVIGFKPEVKYETNIPFEDTMIVNVKFKNGMIGKLTHSWRVPNKLKGISLSKIYGTDGVITFESNGLYVSVYGKRKIRKFFSPLSFLGFKDMLKSFIEDFQDGKEWKPDMERIREEMKLIEGAYKSLKSGKLEKI